jgi:hypothetical protein
MQQAALAAGGDRPSPETQGAQLGVRDHRVVLGGQRRDQPIDMLERYLNTCVRERDRSSITWVIERYRCAREAFRSRSFIGHGRSITRTAPPVTDRGVFRHPSVAKL